MHEQCSFDDHLSLNIAQNFKSVNEYKMQQQRLGKQK
jgi:hypothetical protein